MARIPRSGTLAGRGTGLIVGIVALPLADLPAAIVQPGPSLRGAGAEARP